MAWFLYLVSIIWIIMGTVLVLYTDWIRSSLKELVEKKNYRFLSPIPFVFGVLLVISAGWSEFFWLIFLLGLVGVAKGLYLFLAPKNQLEIVMKWWFDEASDRLYRFVGLICLVLGIALLSWIR